MNSTLRRIRFLPSVASAAFLIGASVSGRVVIASETASRPGIAATVNGQDIPLSQVSDLTLRIAGPGIVEQQIGNLLVHQEAKKRGCEAAPAEIDAEIAAIRDRIQPRTLDDLIAQRHLTNRTFRDTVQAQLELRKLLTKTPMVDLKLADEAPKYIQSLRQAGKVVVYLGQSVVGPPGVAATVNGEDIPLSQISDIALKVAGPSTVDELIVNLLVRQRAKQQGVEATPPEIDGKIDAIREQIKPQALEEALRQRHMQMDDLRETQRVRVEVEKLIAKTLRPFPMVHVRHLLIATQQPGAVSAPSSKPHTEAEARAIVAKIQQLLKAGGKFEDLARRYSEDPANRDRGGDLGVITSKASREPEFVAAAMALKAGEITPIPVKLPYGLDLIQAESTADHPLPSDKPLYAEAEKQARAQEIQAQLHGYIPSLRVHSQIVNYLAP